MRTRVLGLGNTILSDDGVGIYVARGVAERLRERRPAAEVGAVGGEERRRAGGGGGGDDDGGASVVSRAGAGSGHGADNVGVAGVRDGGEARSAVLSEAAAPIAWFADGASEVDVVEAEIAGLDLLDLLEGWDRVIVIDALQVAGLAPGEVAYLEPAAPRSSLRLRGVHDVDLPTALALGERLGRKMPREVTVIGIQAVDMATFGETLTPAVAAAVPRAIEVVLDLLELLESRCP